MIIKPSGFGRAFAFCVAALTTVPALAQRTAENAVTSAEDAFGATLGNESIGIYSPFDVRGFSPIAAGNVRIESLYFDRQSTPPRQLFSGSAIRVGLSAQSYPFPAPTGIVDYRIKRAGEERILSLVAAVREYGAPGIEVDARLPVSEQFSVAATAAYDLEEYYDGADAKYTRVAIAPRWQPGDNLELVAFGSMVRGRDEEVAPTIITAGSWLPPAVPRRRYFGQNWAINEADDTNFGAIAKARLGNEWALSGGVFRSSSSSPQGFADLYVGTLPDGSTTELVIADPEQRYVSTSGELRVSRSFVDGDRLHVINVVARARSQDSIYGGSADPIDLGVRQLGVRVPAASPSTFSFSERTRDAVDQWAAGLHYEGRWRNVGEWGLGGQYTDYRKVIEQPEQPSTSTTDRPWLTSATVAAFVTEKVALYAGYTQGLEETGIAPDNATNRNQALPAIRTRQRDAGLRWMLPLDLKLVAGIFEVEKPYFTTDESGFFTTLGDVRHRGIEASLSGSPFDRLSLVAGAVLMDPRVVGEAVRLGRTSDRPVGEPEQLVRISLDYRFAFLPALSLDMTTAHTGSRVASRDGTSVVSGYTLVDLGARYRFQLGQAPATLRAQLLNAGNELTWEVDGNNTFGLTDKRRFALQIAVDL